MVETCTCKYDRKVLIPQQIPVPTARGTELECNGGHSSQLTKKTE